MVNLNNGNSRRKRARLQLIEPFDGNSSDLDDDDASTESQMPTSPGSNSYEYFKSDCAQAPTAFLCPLTLQIMYDPVLDGEGNSFERRTILKWLREDDSNSISPISRKPLCEDMLVPNNALRDLVHQFMGSEWVERKADEENRVTAAAAVAADNAADEKSSTSVCHPKLSRYRGKVNSFLVALSNSGEFGGLAGLSLNKNGSAAFRYDDLVFVIDVPEPSGMMFLYTREFLRNPGSDTKTRLLELNFLQGKLRKRKYWVALVPKKSIL